MKRKLASIRGGVTFNSRSNMKVIGRGITDGSFYPRYNPDGSTAHITPIDFRNCTTVGYGQI